MSSNAVYRTVLRLMTSNVRATKMRPATTWASALIVQVLLRSKEVWLLWRGAEWRSLTTKLLLLLLLCSFISPAKGQSGNQPNIIIILADDMGYGDVGFSGSPDIPTPNIDSIARNGVLCTDGYVTHPFCSPSRAALLTGRYSQRDGCEIQPVAPIHNNLHPLLGLI